MLAERSRPIISAHLSSAPAGPRRNKVREAEFMPGYHWTETRRFAPGRQVVTREVDGRVRRFTIQMPSGTGEQPRPVGVVLHGAGASGSHYLAKSGVAEQ